MWKCHGRYGQTQSRRTFNFIRKPMRTADYKCKRPASARSGVRQICSERLGRHLSALDTQRDHTCTTRDFLKNPRALFSMQAAISAGDGSLPKRASSISVTATLLHSPKRLVYSAHPSRIHASLSLPTATICSPIIRSPFQTERTAGPPAKESHAPHAFRIVSAR